jgi:hypothetical protein
MNSYKAIILSEAEEDLEELDPLIRKRCLTKIEWLSFHLRATDRKYTVAYTVVGQPAQVTTMHPPF